MWNQPNGGTVTDAPRRARLAAVQIGMFMERTTPSAGLRPLPFQSDASPRDSRRCDVDIPMRYAKRPNAARTGRQLRAAKRESS